jgi:hypothetical protein
MKAGIAGPEYMIIARQQNGHVFEEKNNHATKEELSENMFSVRSIPSCIRRTIGI